MGFLSTAIYDHCKFSESSMIYLIDLLMVDDRILTSVISSQCTYSSLHIS